MKIVHCIFTMFTGGAQMLAVDIINHSCINNQVSLIIVNNEVNFDIVSRIDKRVKIYYINRPQGSKNPYYIIKLNLRLLRLKPDILHCHEFNMTNLIFIPSIKVLTIHDVGICSKSLKKYNALVAISEAVSNDIMNRFSLETFMISNGVFFDDISVKNDYDLTNSKEFKLVQVSRLMHEKKGQDILLNALSILIHKRGLSNIKLYLIGEGESKVYLSELVKKLSIEKYVVFIGNKPRSWIMENLKEFNVLVQPSIYEGFGLTIIEGIGAGLPVVASNIEGPREILYNLERSWLFEVGNYNQLTEVIMLVYNSYYENKIIDKVDRVRDTILNKYSISNTANNYLHLYKKIISNED